MKNYIYIFFLLITSLLFSQEKNVFDIARFGTVMEMESIIKSNKNVINTVDENGFSPLILATYINNEAIVVFLVKKIKDINYNTISGTALTAASYKGFTKIVEILLKNNANPNIADAKGTTPLIYATISENIDIIKLLIAYKVNKTHKDQKGNSALEYALFGNNEKLINLLK